MNWVKRKDTTVKREMNPAVYDKSVFTWKRKLPKQYLNIKLLAMLNFDQRSLGFASRLKTTYAKEELR